MSLQDAVIQVEHLTRKFGQKHALNDVSLEVMRGSVFGLVGENGAGKTTLIKHIIGAFRAQSGTVRVFGMDPVEKTTDVLAKIGFLSEDRTMPSWMGVKELMDYTSAFYPAWDGRFAEEMRDQFELDRKAKVKNLSRGEKAKLGLLLALAHRPDLLVLDEPSSGLDLVVRRQILTAIVRTVAEEGRTVIFSSHLLDEVERMADDIAMVVHGKLVLRATMEEIKSTYHRLRVSFEEVLTTAPRIPGVLWCEGEGDEWTLVCNGQSPQVKASILELKGSIVEEGTPSLDEIFLAHCTAKTSREG